MAIHFKAFWKLWAIYGNADSDMKKAKQHLGTGDVVAIPLVHDQWVYVAILGCCMRLFKFCSNGLIRGDTIFEKKDWCALIYVSYLRMDCLTVGKISVGQGDIGQFSTSEKPSSDHKFSCQIFDGKNFRMVSQDEAANLEKCKKFQTVVDFRNWVMGIVNSLPRLTGVPTPKPPPPKPMNITFKFRNLLSTENMDPEAKAQNSGYKERLAHTPWAVEGVKQVTESLAGRMALAIKEWEYEARIREISTSEGFISVECSSADAKHFLSVMRREIALDARDHHRFRFVEIEQRGPSPNEVKIFGTKGPAKFESGVEPLKEKSAVFDADGRDADTFSPFTLEDQRMEKDSPEVRLEFEDFDGLDETLDLEDGLELDGNTLGDIIMAVIDKKKLVKDKEGTHPGGYFDNCEGETVLFHFNSLRDAVAVAGHFQKIFTDKRKLRTMLKAHVISP